MRWNSVETLVVKNARFGFVVYFVKFWAKNPISVHVGEKSCNQTHFV